MGNISPTRLLRRLWFLIHSRRRDAELAEEIAAHQAMAQAAIEADGVPADAAVHAARRAMGNTALARDRARDVWQPRWLQGIGQDVRLAFRMLAAAPLISFVAVLSLGLGIGGNTAIFSIVNSIYLRPLAVPEPDRLISVVAPASSGISGRAVWERLSERPEMFARVAAFAETQFNISSSTRAEWVDGLWVSGSFFDTIGIASHAGRLLTEADDREGGGPDGPVAVISHALWQRRYGGTADVIGRVVHLQRAPFTIVGVMPPQFSGPTIGRAFDVVAPRRTSALVWAPMDIDGEIVEVPFSPKVIARLHQAQTMDQATAALETLLDDRSSIRGRGAAPAAPADRGWRATPLGSRSPARSQYERSLVVLTVVVALVLLIACSNIANLMLARAAVRQQELSVRRAIGAPRWRLVRQCLTESIVLAGVGAICGLVVAFGASELILRQLAAENVLTAGDIAYGSAALVLDASFDWRVLAFTAVVTGVTALAFGLVPALRSARTDPIGAIKEGSPAATLGTGSTSHIAHVRIGATGTILVLQVAMSLVLVVGAALFVGTLSRLTAVPLGFDARNVVLVNLDLARASSEARLEASARIRDTVRALPDVRAAAVSAGGPPFGGSVVDAVAVVGVPPPANQEVNVTIVSEEWFEAFAVALQSGRPFNANDRAGAPKVAIVNQAFARRFLGGTSPLGRQVAAATTYAPWPPVDIVGVVADTASIALREPPAPAVYLPLAQVDGRLHDAVEITLEERGLTLVVRAADGRRGAVIGSLAEAVQRVEPAIGTTFKFPDQQIDAMLTRERVLATLAGFFGGLALLLSGLGLYGVAAYAVARQRKEIAVRMALGAAAHSVFRLVLGRVLLLVGAGIVAGVIASLWATQLIASFLYGTGPRDVTTFVLAAIVLLIVGGLAAWLPARRATRTDPALVLRYE